MVKRAVIFVVSSTLSTASALTLGCLPDFETLPDDTGRRDGDEGEGEGEGEAGEGEGEGEGEVGEGEGEGPALVVDRLDVVGGAGFSQGYGLALANDGSVALAAEYAGLLPTINEFQLPVPEEDTCVVAVVDEAGEAQWIRRIEPISQHGLCVGGMRFTDDNAALYVTGGANIAGTVFGFDDPDEVDFSDAYVTRLNAATGDIEWLVDLPDSAGLEVLAVDDGVVLVLSFTGQLTLDGVELQSLSGAAADIAVLKLEAETGAAVWGSVIGSTDDDVAVAAVGGTTVQVGLTVNAGYHSTGTELALVDDEGVAVFPVQLTSGAVGAPAFLVDAAQLRIAGIAAHTDGSFHVCGRQGPATTGFDDGWLGFVDASGAAGVRLNAGGGCNAMVADGVGGAFFVDSLSNFETSISYGAVSVDAPAGGGGNDIALGHVNARGVVDAARSFGGSDSDFASLLARAGDRLVFGGDIRSEFTVDGVSYNPSGESDAAFFGLRITH